MDVLPDPPVLFVMAALLAIACGAVLVAVDLAQRLHAHERPEPNHPGLQASIFALNEDYAAATAAEPLLLVDDAVVAEPTPESVEELVAKTQDLALAPVLAEVLESEPVIVPTVTVAQAWLTWVAQEARRYAQMPMRLAPTPTRKALGASPQRLALGAVPVVQVPTMVVDVVAEEDSAPALAAV